MMRERVLRGPMVGGVWICCRCGQMDFWRPKGGLCLPCRAALARIAEKKYLDKGKQISKLCARG